MKFKLGMTAAIASLVMATSAYAASMSIVGGQDYVLGTDGSHNPDYSALAPGLVPSVGNGSTVKAFGSNYEAFNGLTFAGGGNGLRLDSVAKVTITFLGKEAAAEDIVLNKAGSSIKNTDAVGTSIVSIDLPDWIDLTFETYGITNPTLFRGSITNNEGQITGAGVPGDAGLSLAFYQESSKSVLAFFGDGRGDDDFDDMVVRISIIPLPAGGLLLLTALGGLGIARRKKKA